MLFESFEIGTEGVNIDSFERRRDVEITRIPERLGVISNESSNLFDRERILSSSVGTPRSVK
jgi:hypothetical protein